MCGSQCKMHAAAPQILGRSHCNEQHLVTQMGQRRRRSAKNAGECVTTPLCTAASDNSYFDSDNIYSHGSHFMPPQIRHSTVTDLARFLGLSTSVPRANAV